jgi:hypothetical protein
MKTDLSVLAQRIEEETGHYAGGPLRDFEKVGRHTLLQLITAGLLPSHRLLDFGCGSLRNGYWFIRFLDSDNYYGIEPVEKGVRAGLKHLIGPELEAIKQPSFNYSDDNDIGAFGVSFDYVVARSILTHTCPGMLHRILETFASSSPNGTMYASYWRHDLPEVPPPKGSKENPYHPRWKLWKPYSLPIPEEIKRYRNMAVTLENLKEGQLFAVGDDLPDDDMRFIEIITYSLSTVQEIAEQYGLSAEEDWTMRPVNKQIWLKIQRKG